MPELNDAGIAAVARKLCASAEYHEGNWRLYVPKARELIAAYFVAAAQESGT